MSDSLFRQVLSRMNMREVLVAPGFKDAVIADLRMLAVAIHEDMDAGELRRKNELVASFGFAPSEQRKPFAFSNGVAIIPVHGTLINRFGYSWGFVTGYNYIRQQTALAGQDMDVKGIVYDHNSHGGEAAGCFECAADLPKLANDKPTIAMIDSNCYSGSYALAAVARRISSVPSGGSGSIGVASIHASYEKLLADAGIELTIMFIGDHKVDGNPYQKLPDSVKKDIESSMLKTYDVFVGHVSTYRKLDNKAVRATEARCYRADEAKSLGLIDAIAAPQSALEAFMGELNGSNSQLPTEDIMSDTTNAAAEKAALEAREAQIKADAIKADRERVAAITSCEEAKGRTALASHLALKSDMNLETAKAVLAAAPKETTEVPVNPLDAAMAKTGGGPKVGADAGGGEGDGEDSKSRVAAWAANARTAGVIDREPIKH